MSCCCYQRFAHFFLLFLQIRLNGFYLFTDHLNSTSITFFLLLFFPPFAIFIKKRTELLVTVIISLQKLAHETDCRCHKHKPQNSIIQSLMWHVNSQGMACPKECLLLFINM